VRNEKNKDTDFKYIPSSIEELKSFMRHIGKTLQKFSKDTGIYMTSIKRYGFLLIEINRCIDQMKEYYQYFHFDETNTELSEKIRETALLCYWVIKYKPFYLEKTEAEAYWDKYHCTINERFALYMIESLVRKTFEFIDKKAIHFFSPENRRKILFYFTHRDISQESFILFVSSLISQIEI